MSQTSPSEPTLVLSEISSALNSSQIPYFLVGSFASGLRGKFRATNDIDIVCKMTHAKAASLFKLLADKFYIDDVAASSSIDSNLSFNIIHQETFMKVDLFPVQSELEENEFGRASKIMIPGVAQEIFVSSAEYNIIAKLRWYKKSGKQLDRQVDDVRGIVAANQSSLDLDFLGLWSKKLGVDELLAEVMS